MYRIEANCFAPFGWLINDCRALKVGSAKATIATKGLEFEIGMRKTENSKTEPSETNTEKNDKIYSRNK